MIYAIANTGYISNYYLGPEAAQIIGLFKTISWETITLTINMLTVIYYGVISRYRFQAYSRKISGPQTIRNTV